MSDNINIADIYHQLHSKASNCCFQVQHAATTTTNAHLNGCNTSMHLYLEALAGVTPQQEQDVIERSFKQNVISDLLASASTKPTNFEWDNCNSCSFAKICDKSTKGDVAPATQILKDLQHKVPEINFNKYIKPDDVDRVMISFDESGTGGIIRVPKMLNKILGPIIILHEIAHKLYSIDILTKQIVNHPLAAEIFTLARTIEDARVEKLMERDYPHTAAIYKQRAKYIVPLYKSHEPTKFSKIVDDLFLKLRGYQSSFDHDAALLSLGQQFVDAGNDRDAKVKIVIALAEMIHNK